MTLRDEGQQEVLILEITAILFGRGWNHVGDPATLKISTEAG